MAHCPPELTLLVTMDFRLIFAAFIISNATLLNKSKYKQQQYLMCCKNSFSKFLSESCRKIMNEMGAKKKKYCHKQQLQKLRSKVEFSDINSIYQQQD